MTDSLFPGYVNQRLITTSAESTDAWKLNAEEVAEALRAAGYDAGSLVAISGDSSAAVLDTVLGCLTAGIPFMPMDLRHPREWRVATAARAGAALHLEGAWWAGRSPLVFPPPAARRAKLPPAVAYVMPTSGSTGAPKLPMISRGALAEHVAITADRYGLERSDRVLQTASFGFDVWLEECLTALHAGASLILSREGLRRSFDEFGAMVSACGASVLNLPTGYWLGWFAHLLRTGAPRPEPRLVVVGSERVPTAQFEDWLCRWPDGPRLLSAYGLTESTITAFVFDPDRDRIPAAGRSVPLGRPLPGIRYAFGESNPDGARELLLGGSRVMLGYLGEAGRIEQPPADNPGGWLRTGDLVRQVDGELCIVGRADGQVKIGGVRVTPELVEAELGAIDAVREAGVGYHGRLGLVALVVAQNAGTSTQRIRELMAAAVPSAFVPARIVLVDDLPRQRSGKLDRRAVTTRIEELAALPRVVSRHVENGSAPPSDGDWLAGLVAEVLDAEPRPEISFVAQGGNSLQAAVVLTRLSEHGYRLAVSELLEHAPLSQVAEKMARRVPVRPAGDDRIEAAGHTKAPLTQQQLAVWLQTALHPSSRAYNAQSVVHFDGRLDQDALLTALDRLFVGHQVLRIAVDGEGDMPMQRVVDGAPIPLDVVEAESSAEAAQARLVARAFDPTEAPMARWTLVNDHDRSSLYIVEHHLIHDGVSFALLMRELVDLLEGRTPRANHAVAYLDYAHWHDARVAAGAYADGAHEWADHLHRVRDLAGLAARSAGSQDRRSGVRIEWLRAEFADACREAARTVGVTLFSFLLSCYQSVLADHYGQRDFAVGVSVANRLRPELADTVGMFVNTVAVPHSGAADPHDAVLATASELAWAYDRQEVPFGLVVKALKPTRNPSSTPVYQATFNFDDAPLAPVTIGGLTGTVVELQNGFAKVDLSLVAIPQLEQRRLSGTVGGDHRIKLIWQYRRSTVGDPVAMRLAAAFVATAARRVRDILGTEPQGSST